MKEGDKVNLIIGKETPLGFNVLIDHEYEGLLYRSEVFTELLEGDHVIGYIKKIREDNKIDVSLTPQGYKNNIDIFKKAIIEELKKSDGFLSLSDKSSPTDIKEVLNMSKKNFKKAIGSLYKDKLISLKEEGIFLNKK